MECAKNPKHWSVEPVLLSFVIRLLKCFVHFPDGDFNIICQSFQQAPCLLKSDKFMASWTSLIFIPNI